MLRNKQVANTSEKIKSHFNLWLILGVFFFSVTVTLLFWQLFPMDYESTDYVNFYKPVARNILQGRGITHDNGSVAIFYPPGYPIYLAGIFALSDYLGISTEVILSASNLFAAGLSSVLVLIFARSLWGDPLAIISALAWATYPPLLWSSRLPNSENLYVPFLYVGLVLFWRLSISEKNRKLPYFAVGILIGCSMLIRSMAIGLGVLLCILTWFFEKEKRSKRARQWAVVMIITGNLLVVMPWEGWVFFNTRKIIPLSGRPISSVLDGLTFSIRSEPWRQKMDLPGDVELVERTFHNKRSEMASFAEVSSTLVKLLKEHPIGVVKFLLIKMARGWYARDNRQQESLNLFVQLAYLALIAVGWIVAWRSKGIFRQFSVLAGLLTMYSWAISILVTPLLRYMFPVFGLLFVLLPGILKKLFVLRWSNSGHDVQPHLSARN